MSDYTFPWPEEGGTVVIQQPDDPKVREANYIRARACIHACEGIPTEVLENAFMLVAWVKDIETKEMTYFESIRRYDGEKQANQEGGTT